MRDDLTRLSFAVGADQSFLLQSLALSRRALRPLDLFLKTEKCLGFCHGSGPELRVQSKKRPPQESASKRSRSLAATSLPRIPRAHHRSAISSGLVRIPLIYPCKILQLTITSAQLSPRHLLPSNNVPPKSATGPDHINTTQN